MPVYAAFLRGVSPMIAKMPEVRRCFEEAGFDRVRSLRSSGNLVFEARRASEAALARRAEAAMARRLGRSFLAIVRPVDALAELLGGDTYPACVLPEGAKRVVTFLREAPVCPPALPIRRDGAALLRLVGREVLGAYQAGPKGPVFMRLIEATFGDELTTRTWETVVKVVGAGRAG